MRIMVSARVATVYPWGTRNQGKQVPIIDSMAHVSDGGVLTQLLQCDKCEEWTDDVAWRDTFGGGLCDECARSTT